LGSAAFHAAKTPDAKVAFSHMLQMIPWITMVPAIGISAAAIAEVQGAYIRVAGFDTAGSGLAFGANFTCLLIWLVPTWFLGLAWSKQPDAEQQKESMPTILLNIANQISVNCASLAFYSIQSVVANAVIGPADGDLHHLLWAKTIQQSIQLLVFSFILAYILPRFDCETADDKAAHALMVNFSLYGWGFSFVNYLWWFFYSYVGEAKGIEFSATEYISLLWFTLVASRRVFRDIRFIAINVRYFAFICVPRSTSLSS
jgi:hypothetical protein